MKNLSTSAPNVFSGPVLPPEFRWHCEPRRWSLGNGCLRIEPDSPTDFWQRTHYGFRADNGHFLYRETDGDFILTARVLSHPARLYDQAGIMVRTSADSWLKSSVEFVPSSPSRLGAVVTTHGYSDWSAQDVPTGVGETWLPVRREANDYIVDASADGTQWSQLRMAHLHDDDVSGCVACGVYACSPTGEGFVCEFAEVSIVPGRLNEGSAAAPPAISSIGDHPRPSSIPRMGHLVTDHLVTDLRHEFRRHKSLADRAMATLDDPEFFGRPAAHVNPVAVIVKHLAGNLTSRWSDFLVADGDEAARDRDTEFLLTGQDTRVSLLAAWERGWTALFDALTSLGESDLDKSVTIRGERHSVAQALLRGLSHAAYHTGQILYLARLWRLDSPWLTIPPGQSRMASGPYLQAKT